MRRFFTVVFLIALAVSLIQGKAENVLAQEEKKKAVYSEGIKVNLTEKEVKEALDWGRKNKDTPKVLFFTYRFSSQAYKGEGYIATKFMALALLGCSSGKRYQSVKRADIEDILNTKVLMISISTYGDKPDFAKDYHMVLKQGGKVIQPVSVDAPAWANTTGGSPENPSYLAPVIASFPYSDIDPKAKTTVILIKDQGDSRFEVDFSHYK
jgi:hypothetical protein